MKNAEKDIVAESFQDETYKKQKEAMLEPLVTATQMYLNQNEQPIIRLSYNDEIIDVEYTRFDKDGKKLIETLQKFNKLENLLNLFPENLDKESNS